MVGLPIPGPSGDCTSCKKRKATQWFAVDGTAAARGYSSPRCDICVLEEQIKHARERAAQLPELERKLAELRAIEGES